MNVTAEVSHPRKTNTSPTLRRHPIGAEFIAPDQVAFRVWAPKRARVELFLFDAGSTAEPAEEPCQIDSLPQPRRRVNLERDAAGYFSAQVDNAQPGQLYGFRLDDGSRLYPDPVSRFQPYGVCGLSELVDDRRFVWSDDAWEGVDSSGQIIYEIHIGTFTPEGTWAAAAEQLAELKRIGITVVEVMPVADFPGQFGWGYDGVAMFAPTRLYGKPDDFRRFVDQAHAVGLGVILDVVYNHFGNFGNYLGEFSDDYCTNRYQNEWAAAINFDGPNSAPVREFFLTNARYWIDEFHLDGFRYDATQCIYDASPRHILAEVTAAARDEAGRRKSYFTAENEPQDVVHLRPADQHGTELDALWNDDFHHSASVRLTGRNPAYYSDYHGSMEELIAAVKYGFLFQGQRSQWQGKSRGTPTHGLPAQAFVSFLQNHDQVANSATGERIHRHTTAGRYRAMTALWLLAPQTPLFFQGQEFAASAPFLFFADFNETDGEMVARGRLQFLQQFPEMRIPETQRRIPDPRRRETFERCRLNFAERESHCAEYALHQDLLALRRNDPIFRSRRADLIDGAALSPDALVLRYFSAAGDDRLLIANFGGDVWLASAPQPLLAPPLGRGWSRLWTSEQPKYGGGCMPNLETEAGWRIPAEATLVLQAVPDDQIPALEPGFRTHDECKSIQL